MVKILEDQSKFRLERKIAEVIKEGHMIQHISYAVSKHGCNDYYSCLLITAQSTK